VKPWCHPPPFLSADHGGRPLLDRRITTPEGLVRTRRQDDLSVRDVKEKKKRVFCLDLKNGEWTFCFPDS
jgi:hypothetical protein